jgi:tetratricopeptide (TPR) repeat protein
MMNSFSKNDATRSFAPIGKGIVISHYQIIERIGAGGMGEVFLAEDTQLNRKVALKFLPPHLCQDENSRARFKREAQAAAALDHPNIVAIYEVSEHQGQPYIVMQYVEGRSLRDIIQDMKLSLDAILDLAIALCEGLKEAHMADVVHRDIKPSNILIDKQNRPKLLDFGLATIKGKEKLTRTGSTVGTIGYMSPEQVEGKETDQRSDIFSLGIVLYEMITGRRPFRGENEAATMHSILHDSPEPLARYKSDVPDELQKALDKALDKDLETRYQTVDGLLTDLKWVRKERGAVIAAHSPLTPRKRPVAKFLIPGSILTIIVLLLLFFKPWTFEIRPAAEAIAAENRLAIMYFDNLADVEDEQRWGEIVTNLLITDLSESHYVQVVSSQRLYDILTLLGREGEKKINRSVATQVATKAGAKLMLLGNILQIEPHIILTAQLVDAATGNAIASQRIIGDESEQIFSLVDKLTVEIKKDLALPADAENESDRPIADVTTSSSEAYRYYLEGVDYAYKLYGEEAKRSFRKALEYDSTFAMVYYYLAVLEEWSESRGAKEFIAKAVEYSDRASWKEKHYIKSWEAANIYGNSALAIEELEKIIDRYPDEKRAFMFLGFIYLDIQGNPEGAIRPLTKAIEIDPLYKFSYNMLAYAYHEIGDYDKSIWAINEYISIAPNEANPYDTRGDLYAFNGKIDEAIESYKAALQIKSDFFLSLNKLGHLYLLKKEYAKAESCYQKLSSGGDKRDRSSGRTFLAFIPLYQGKFEEALRILDNGLAADRMEQYYETEYALKHFVKAEIYREKRNLDAAIGEVEQGLNIWHKAYPSDPVYWRHYYIQLLVEDKRIEKAKEIIRALKIDIETGRQFYSYAYWLASSYIELAQGNTETVVPILKKALVYGRSKDYADRLVLLSGGVLLGAIYLESGRLGEAVAELEKVLSRYDITRAIFAIRGVKAHYLLGLAYEKSGWTNKAIKQYEEFLDIWKDADPGIREIEDAKERLARLKNGP